MTDPSGLISIVIPCYNASAWIAETIASAAGQRDVPVEIILVDDGSDDDSVAIARNAAAGTTLTVISQHRMGASRARNVGTASARGTFIQYLDADDVLMPGTLRRRVDRLEAGDAGGPGGTGGPGGDVAYCDWLRWERQADGSFRDSDVVRRVLGARPDVELFDDAWWPPAALLFRREVVSRIMPWREDLPVIQDARFCLDAALSGARFVHVDHVGARYRSYPDSLSRRDPRAFLEDCLHNGLDLQALWERTGSLDQPRRRTLVKLYAYLSRSFFRIDRGRFEEVVGHLKALEPQFLPDGPPLFRALTRIVGYPAAEYVAGVWHGVRGSAARLRGPRPQPV